jgi:hypothetical protein
MISRKNKRLTTPSPQQEIHSWGRLLCELLPLFSLGWGQIVAYFSVSFWCPYENMIRPTPPFLPLPLGILIAEWSTRSTILFHILIRRSSPLLFIPFLGTQQASYLDLMCIPTFTGTLVGNSLLITHINNKFQGTILTFQSLNCEQTITQHCQWYRW